MKRLECPARSNWHSRLEETGFEGHSYADDLPYWLEGTYYELTVEEVDNLVDAAVSVYSLLKSTVQHVIENDEVMDLGVPLKALPAILRSWGRNDFSLCTRLDFVFTTEGVPQLYTLRPDVPYGLLEAGEAQWQWKEDIFPEKEQYNTIYELLVKTMRESYFRGERIHFSARRSDEDAIDILEYLEEIALEVGCSPAISLLDELVWDEAEAQLKDHHGEQVESLFKICPWVNLLQGRLGQQMVADEIRLLEPCWKLLAASKGMLVKLKQLFPDSPYLPDAGWLVENPDAEGRHLTCFDDREHPEQEALGLDFGKQPDLWVASSERECFDGRYPLFTVWLIGGVPAGVGILEDSNPDPGERCQFVPHIFLDE